MNPAPHDRETEPADDRFGIEVRGVSHNYGAVRALRDVSLSIARVMPT